jgi:hypothetical protein
MTDEPDNPGIRVPPPPVSPPCRPRWRVLGWPLVGGGMALAVWFVRTMSGVDTTIRIDKPVSSLVQNGPFRHSRKPGYDLCWDSRSSECAVGHPTLAVGGVRDPARGDRARGALFRTHLRRGIPELQDKGAPVGIAGATFENSPSETVRKGSEELAV